MSRIPRHSLPSPLRVRRLGRVVAPLLLALGLATPLAGALSTPPLSLPVTHPLGAGHWTRLDTAGGEMFALSTSGRLATSRDGRRWRVLTTPSGDWNVLAYGAGRFVALSANGQSLSEMTSLDGHSWSALAAPIGPWTGLQYGEGRFVAVSRAGQFMTSTDGLHWTMTWIRSQFHTTSLAYGAGRFVAVDAHDGDDLISVNGVNWSFYPITGVAVPWSSVSFANGVFVALSPAGLSATSMLGYDWVTHPVPRGETPPRATSVCSSVVGVETTSSGPTVVRSGVGDSWSATPLRSSEVSSWTDVAGLGRVVTLLGARGALATWTIPGYCGPSLPSPPRDVSGNTESGQVWTYQHPSSDGGGAGVDRYVVTLRGPGGSHSCIAAPSYEPHCLIQGLANNHPYTLTTVAHNRFGNSAPSDPEWVVPVAHWTLATWSPTPRVKSGSPFVVYVTGILANSEGIYPAAPVSVHVGSTTLSCVPSPFGECRFSLLAPAPGRLELWSSYTGYGVFYRSATTTVSVTP